MTNSLLTARSKTSPLNWLPLTAILLSVFAVDILFMPRLLWQSDALIWRQESASILEHGRLWIDAATVADTGSVPGQSYDLNPIDGRWYSKYGIANSIISIPPMVAERWLTGSYQPGSPTDIRLLNAWNISFSLSLAGMLFLICGRYTSNPWHRCAYVMVCFFATYLWYYQRAQGGEIYQPFFFAATYESLLRALKRPKAPSTPWLAAVWFFVGFLVLTRVFYAFLIPLTLLLCCVSAILHRQSWRRAISILIGGPLLILLTLGWINNLKFGSPYLTGYHQWRPEDHSLTGSWFDGVYGLLFSCHWGIFIYFPVLLLSLPNWQRFIREHAFDAWMILGIFGATLLLLGSIPTWRGEWTYGPRYMLFILPILALPSLYVFEGLNVRTRRAAGAALLLGISIWMQCMVNRADFWFFYKVEHPLDGRMDRDIAEYLFDRPEAILLQDMAGHRQNLDDTFLFRQIIRENRLTPEQLVLYRRMVLDALDNTNLYWWPPPNPAAQQKSGSP